MIILNTVSCGPVTVTRKLTNDGRATLGYWSVLEVPAQFRVNAIHAALLPTGKVLIIAGSGNNPKNFEARSFATLLWDPRTDKFTLVPTPEDMFCGGHTFLPDGKLLVAGGTRRYEVDKQDITRAAGLMTVRNASSDPLVRLRKGTRFISPEGVVFTSTEEVRVARGASTDIWVQALKKGTGSVITELSRFRIQGASARVYGIAEKLDLETQRSQGSVFSYEFDPQTERYQRVADMNHGRWYPTLVELADGNALAVSGLDKFGRALDEHHELYHRDTKRWIEVPALSRYFPTYPAIFLMADGRLFYSGSTAGYGRSDGAGRVPGIWNPADDSFQPVGGLADPQLLETSASVLLPPAQEQQVMVLGGGGLDESPESTARTAVVDLRAPDPHFSRGADLAEPTRYLSAVILPDDTVLTTGGSRGYRGRGDSNNRIAQIYHPATDSFQMVASPQVGRNYHSEAMLLSDGRVVTLGSEIDNGGQSGAFEQRIEIYSPPYLYHGSRPVLIDGPTVLHRGEVAEFSTPDPDSIATAKLMRPSAVTHTTDVAQRSIALDLTRINRAITLTVPTEAGLVPPGWYMLFVTNRAGTPSIARWVQVL